MDSSTKSHLLFLAALSILSLLISRGQASQQVKLIPEEGESLDFFGFSVALDGDYVLVSELRYNRPDGGGGLVHVFDRTTSSLVNQLAPEQDVLRQQFGTAIALQGDTAIVGAASPFVGGTSINNFAYLYDLRTGTELNRLQPETLLRGDGFGNSVAIDDGLALVGAWNSDRRGAAYVFDVATGVELAKLVPTGGRHRFFGNSVAIDNGVALIGAPRDTNNRNRAGAAYLFDAITGEQLAMLTPQVDAIDFFGTSVAIDGNLALVTATGNDRDGVAPAAYIFDVTSGEQIASFSPRGLVFDNQFGFSAALEDGVAFVGAPFWDETNSLGGSVYAFDASSGELITRLTPYDDIVGDTFGSSVAVDQGRAVVGAYLTDGAARNSGAAYLIDLSGIPEPSSFLLCLAAVAGIGNHRDVRGRDYRDF